MVGTLLLDEGGFIERSTGSNSPGSFSVDEVHSTRTELLSCFLWMEQKLDLVGIVTPGVLTALHDAPWAARCRCGLLRVYADY